MRYLFIGGEADGLFVETNGEQEYSYCYDRSTVFSDWLNVGDVAAKTTVVKRRIYTKVWFTNNKRKVMFYTLEGTVFDKDLMSRVLRLLEEYKNETVNTK